MAIPLLYMFSPTVGKSKSSYALEDMSYFYDREKPRTFGILNQILWDTETELFKTHETGTVPEKQGQMKPMGLRNNSVKKVSLWKSGPVDVGHALRVEPLHVYLCMEECVWQLLALQQG
jgi:hypothetical protein